MKEFFIGNIVKWNGSLWIVEDWHKDTVDLIDATHCSCKACPTKTWPENPAKRMDSIEFVADSMMEYIEDRIKMPFNDLFSPD